MTPLKSYAMASSKNHSNFSLDKTHMLLRNHMNKSESNIPLNEEVKRNALTQARREELLKMAADAFMNPSKIDLEEVMKNKWLRWKYRDQIDAENKRRSKWLDEAEDAPTGFAIGRRIYEKAEIIVSFKINLKFKKN